MTYIPLGKIISQHDSLYKLTLLAAKRAIELSNGSPKLIETNSEKITTISLEEILQGKVKYRVKEEKRRR